MTRRFWHYLIFFVLGILLGLMIASPSRATYKPEFAGHSEQLKAWFRNAELTDEARKRMQVGWHSCCEQSERVKPSYHVSKTDNGDEWSYLCDGSRELEAACKGVAVGSYKQIPHDIVHQDEIELKNPDNDPKVTAEEQQLRTEGVLFILKDGTETCFWPPASGN